MRKRNPFLIDKLTKAQGGQGLGPLTPACQKQSLSPLGGAAARTRVGESAPCNRGSEPLLACLENGDSKVCPFPVTLKVR